MNVSLGDRNGGVPCYARQGKHITAGLRQTSEGSVPQNVRLEMLEGLFALGLRVSSINRPPVLIL